MLSALNLNGVSIRPAQVWGNTRLIPLVREEPVQDLRMALRGYDAALTVAMNSHTMYTSYVPHGLVMRWTTDGEPVVPVDTALGSKDAGRAMAGGIQVLRHMVRREGPLGLRLLPLHLAMEAFLTLQFGGPHIVNQFWSRRVRQHGLSPRTEQSTRSAQIPGLAEALALFERTPGQCGMLVFVGDHLASATLVGHPEDYALLHRGLVADFYGPLFAQWGWAFRDVPVFNVELSGTTLDEIRASLAQAREDEARFTEQMADGLIGPVQFERVRTVGRFTLQRFHTGFASERASRVGGDHIGEGLFDDAGRAVYLKTYRLDRGQVRRAHLLSSLGEVDWDPAQLAAKQGHHDLKRLVADFVAADLGWMVDPHGIRVGRP